MHRLPEPQKPEKPEPILTPRLQGFIAGASTAGPAAALVANRNGIPTHVFEWIIANGLDGALLVAVFVLGLVVAWLGKRLLASEAERRVDGERLWGQQVELARASQRTGDRMAGALDRNTRVLEHYRAVVDFGDENGGEPG